MTKSKVNRDNYITIQGFMLSDLNLKGNELIIYAIIYGFSQTENQSFTGSMQYLADWTNSTRRQVINCLKSLVDKGLVVKKENVINNVKYCEYSALDGVVKKLHRGGEKISQGVVKKLHRGGEKISQGGGEKISHNNINIYIKENNIKDSKKERKKQTYDEVLSAIEDQSLKELYLEYIKMRKLIKSPMTDRALAMLINKVDSLEPYNVERKKQLLENAIMNNWKSVYPLKDENQTRTAPQKQDRSYNQQMDVLKELYADAERKKQYGYDSKSN